MRLKHVKGADIIVNNSKYVINNPSELRGKFKEVFNNSLDEMNNKQNAHKKIKRIYVSFSEKKQKFTVMDEGRGIPMDILKDAVMTKHVTTKNLSLSDSRNKKQTGLNGKLPMPF